MSALQAGVLSVNGRGKTESTIHYVHDICRGFNCRQRLESRGRLENEGTKRTTTQVLTIIQKVPETVIRLILDEEYCSGGPQVLKG